MNPKLVIGFLFCIILAGFASSQIEVIENNKTESNETENETVVPPPVVEEEEEIEEPEEPKEDVEEVSICDGCIVDKNCLDVGVQKDDEKEATYYCDHSHKMIPAKNTNDACAFNHECRSFRCPEGYCMALDKFSDTADVGVGFILFVVFSLLVVIGLGVLYVMGFDFKTLSFPQDIKKKRAAARKAKGKGKVKLKEHKFDMPGIEDALKHQKVKFERKDVSDTERKLRESLDKFKKFRR